MDEIHLKNLSNIGISSFILNTIDKHEQQSTATLNNLFTFLIIATTIIIIGTIGLIIIQSYIDSLSLRSAPLRSAHNTQKQQLDKTLDLIIPPILILGINITINIITPNIPFTFFITTIIYTAYTYIKIKKNREKETTENAEQTYNGQQSTEPKPQADPNEPTNQQQHT